MYTRVADWSTYRACTCTGSSALCAIWTRALTDNISCHLTELWVAKSLLIKFCEWAAAAAVRWTSGAGHWSGRRWHNGRRILLSSQLIPLSTPSRHRVQRWLGHARAGGGRQYSELGLAHERVQVRRFVWAKLPPIGLSRSDQATTSSPASVKK
jgi:hypothetical protein